MALGASAGGLDSLSRFLDGLPDGVGAAFVVVMHLDPSRESALPELLQYHTDLPVVKIEDRMPLAPDHVYVIPPGEVVTIEAGTFRLAPRNATDRHTVDVFFRSLAKERGENAVAVVLSGTGADGTLGLGEVKERGGLTVAEDPARASHGQMPRSAIDSGSVDLVLGVELMGAELARHLTFEAEPSSDGDEERHLASILALVAERSGHDFTGYKQKTVRRRIERRQQLARAPTLEDYRDHLARDGREVEMLLRDLLINVTRFFRDAEDFGALTETTLSDLIDGKRDDESLRAWVAGCATGEEAYSLAILIREILQARGRDIPVQIFATDLDARSLDIARQGIYPESIEADVSSTRIERFFVRNDHTYQVSKRVREMLVFSTHNMTRDPPFSRLDVVSCRNVLIYMAPELQQELLRLFHFALKPDGFLFLGASETIGEATGLFSPVSKKGRIFRRLPLVSGVGSPFPARSAPERVVQRGTSTGRTGWASSRPTPAFAAQKALLRSYAPPAVLINRENEVVYFLGETGRYLVPPPGAPDLDVIHMSRAPLKIPMHTAIHAVRSANMDDRDVVRSGPIRLATEQGEEDMVVELAVRRVRHPTAGEGSLLVAFESGSGRESKTEIRGGTATLPSDGLEPSDVLERLQEDLQETRDNLAFTIQELEAANEDLTSSNEELLSMNEELQSTNEELATSKEELGSVNQELLVVNAELRQRIEESRKVNADLENLMDSTRIATVFLDADLLIRRFTPRTTEIFRLISTDRGRPLSDIASRLSLGSAEMERRIRESMTNPGEREEELEDNEGRRFLMRINPYRTHEGAVDGTVLTFIDITQQKRLEDHVRSMAESIQSFPVPFIVVDDEWKVTHWNSGAELVYGYTADDMTGRSYLDLVPAECRDAARSHLERTKNTGQSGETTAQRVASDGRVFPVRHHPNRVSSAEGATTVTISDRDITETVRSERLRELLVRELDHRVKNTLTIVEGILEQTLSASGSSPKDFVPAFRARLNSLAVAHRVMASGAWQGADLRELVTLTVEPLRVADRIRIRGEEVVLPDFVVSPLAMAFHELTTNAVRHGALSVPEGEVDVQWSRMERGEVQINWTESGGPPVHEPSQSGFGTKLIREGLPYEIGGSAVIRFHPEGVRYELKIPLQRRGE